MLGVPSSWAKGTYVSDQLGHNWIGVQFRNDAPGECTITVPQPFNASFVPQGLTRNRQPLFEGEPETGTVLLWRVLGFGGHANPLVYSRVACFACRSPQALLLPKPTKGGPAQGRLQLYVDDPALTLSGDPLQRQRAIDIFTLWLLVLVSL